VEEVLHRVRLHGVPVDEVLVAAADHDRARDSDRLAVFVPRRALARVVVVEHDGDGGLAHAALTLQRSTVRRSVAGAVLAACSSTTCRPSPSIHLTLPHLLVHEILQVAGSDLAQVRNAQHEADRVQDVAFSRPVEACSGGHRGFACHFSVNWQMPLFIGEKLPGTPNRLF